MFSMLAGKGLKQPTTDSPMVSTLSCPLWEYFQLLHSHVCQKIATTTTTTYKFTVTWSCVDYYNLCSVYSLTSFLAVGIQKQRVGKFYSAHVTVSADVLNTTMIPVNYHCYQFFLALPSISKTEGYNQSLSHSSIYDTWVHSEHGPEFCLCDTWVNS
jgi:hypothetical protein